jgi:hypothetical protein
MGGMNAMGGPVGGGMPMMNNGGAPGGGLRQQMPANDNQRSQLNTYIYDYFLRHGMYDCARALLSSDATMKVIKESPGRNNDDGEDGDSKDDIDSKRPDDLPRSDVPRECPESCFLYEWWCLFWDMFNAQRGKGEGRNVLNYVNHTNVSDYAIKLLSKTNYLPGTIADETRTATTDAARDPTRRFEFCSISANDEDEPERRCEWHESESERAQAKGDTE